MPFSTYTGPHPLPAALVIDKYMSLIPTSILKIYGESIGIPNISEEVLVALAQDVEYRLREIIQDSTKYMEHGRRLRLSVEHVNMALQATNKEPLFGHDPTEPLNFKQVPNTGLFYDPNEEIDLESFLQEPPPKAPLPLTLTSHWVAIEGVQPAIPENPTIIDKNSLGEPKEAAAIGLASRKEVLEDAEVKANIKHVLSREMQLYFDTIIADLSLSKDMDAAGLSSADPVSNSSDRNKVEAALQAIENDAGVQQLLPYFVQYIADSVPKNLRSLGRLCVLMRLCQAILANANLFIEPYLHQMMPPVLTCLLGKRLCEDPGREDHWSLRRTSADIVAYICRTFGDAYTTLIPRVSKTLSKTLTDPEKSLPSHYGAIVGITKLGEYAIESLLFPILDKYLKALGRESDTAMSDVDHPQRTEVEQVYIALVEAARLWIKANPLNSSPAQDAVSVQRIESVCNNLKSLFGKDLNN